MMTRTKYNYIKKCALRSGAIIVRGRVVQDGRVLTMAGWVSYFAFMAKMRGEE